MYYYPVRPPAHKKTVHLCICCDRLPIGLFFGRESGRSGSKNHMAFYAFYVIAIIVLVLHFTGWLARNNLEWVVLVLAVATFPAVIFLK